MTAMVAWVSNESLVARLWFVVPSLVALQPLLSRRFGTAAMMLAVAWVVAGRSCALGFSWTLDGERVLAGGVSR